MNGVEKSNESDPWRFRARPNPVPPGPLNDHEKFALFVSESNATLAPVASVNVYASLSPATPIVPLVVAPRTSGALATVTGCTLNAYGAGAAPELRRPSITRKYVPGSDSTSVSTSLPKAELNTTLSNGSTSRHVALFRPVVWSK